MKRVPAMGLKRQAILKIWVEMISFKIRFPDLSKANTSYVKTGNSTLLSNEENIRKHKKIILYQVSFIFRDMIAFLFNVAMYR
jgi:hypothetical protein